MISGGVIVLIVNVRKPRLPWEERPKEEVVGLGWPVGMPVRIFLIGLVKLGWKTSQMQVVVFHRLGLELNEEG